VIDAFRRHLDAVHVVRFPESVDPTMNGWNVGSQVHIQVDWHRRMHRTSCVPSILTFIDSVVQTCNTIPGNMLFLHYLTN
jgi:Ser-tRNA(Ala) deacylase AlaX